MVYNIGVAITRPVVNLYNKVKVFNLPDPFPEGKLILSGNHTCWLDPFWLSSVIPRQVRYLAKEELFKNWFLRSLFLKAGSYPVKRGTPDRKAIKFMIETLNHGEIVGIFPEGTRSKNGIGEAHNGAAYIALKTGSPVLPVTINMPNFKFRSEVNIIFHDLIEVECDKKVSKDKLNKLTHDIMNNIVKGLK